MSTQQKVQALIDCAWRQCGTVDVQINNAGAGVAGRVVSSRFFEDARHSLEVDFFGKIFRIQPVLPVMKKQGNGVIVNLTSVVEYKAFPNFGA